MNAPALKGLTSGWFHKDISALQGVNLVIDLAMPDSNK